MAKTKRRKVFTSFTGDEPTWVGRTRKEVDDARLDGEGPTVSFVESRPGDVVLSREDVAEMRELLARALEQNDDEAAHELRALLRGGR